MTIQIPIFSVIMSVFGVTVLKIIPIAGLGFWILATTPMDDLTVAMQRMHMPRFTLSIIITALALQILCALLNSVVKISTHSAAAAGVVGMLLAFSMLFAFDPTYWLCLTILMTGAVNTARLILRQHTLLQIGISNIAGFLCGLLTILLI